MISNELPGGIDIVHSAGPSPDKRKTFGKHNKFLTALAG